MAVTDINQSDHIHQPETRRQQMVSFLKRKSVQNTFLMVFVYLTLVFFAIIISFPLAWMLSTALKTPAQIFTWPIQWIPNPIAWSNFPEALTVRPFFLWTRNSMITAGMSVIGHCLSAITVGYAFSRLQWSGRSILFLVMLSGLMLPQEVSLIPQFLIFSKLGWINTLLPLFVPTFFGGAFNIFVMRQFMMTLPKDLDDAARIDGCGFFTTLWRIIVPQVLPAVGFIAINTFRARWNDFFHPLIYLNDTRWYTLALGLRSFRGEYQVEWGYLMAATLVVMAPVMLLFFVAQRYFIQGVVFTGVKG